MLQGGSVSNVRPVWLDEWARFSSALTFEALPAPAVARTKQVLFDSIGALADLIAA
jgi:hypothetical protein